MAAVKPSPLVKLVAVASRPAPAFASRPPDAAASGARKPIDTVKPKSKVTRGDSSCESEGELTESQERCKKLISSWIKKNAKDETKKCRYAMILPTDGSGNSSADRAAIIVDEGISKKSAFLTYFVRTKGIIKTIKYIDIEDVPDEKAYENILKFVTDELTEWSCDCEYSEPWKVSITKAGKVTIK